MKLAVQEAFNYLVVCYLLSVVMKVVPHDELREREHAENAGVYYFPVLLGFDHSPKGVEDTRDIRALLILADITLKLCGDEIKILAKLLEKRDVYDGVFIRFADNIFSEAELTHDLDRDKHYGREVG